MTVGPTFTFPLKDPHASAMGLALGPGCDIMRMIPNSSQLSTAPGSEHREPKAGVHQGQKRGAHSGSLCGEGSSPCAERPGGYIISVADLSM